MKPIWARHTQQKFDPAARSTVQQCGYTLLEVLIASALSVLVTGATILFYRAQRQAFEQAENVASMRDAGLSALLLIGQQVQMAGFIPADAAPEMVEPIPALFGCSSAKPVGAASNWQCQPLASRSDGLLIRYIGDAISTWPNLAGQTTDCLGQGIGAAGEAALVVNRYYARVSASTKQPELYCEGNGRPGVAQPLVEGVEQLRVHYWVADMPVALQASQLTPAQWAQVVSVDLCVVVRGARAMQRTHYVDCDGAAVLSADQRVRQAFWRQVAVRNQAVGVP